VPLFGFDFQSRFRDLSLKRSIPSDTDFFAVKKTLFAVDPIGARRIVKIDAVHAPWRVGMTKSGRMDA
jgi:hypothetical protein